MFLFDSVSSPAKVDRLAVSRRLLNVLSNFAPALDPTPSIIAQFPHPFHLSYVVSLTKHELSTDLHVVNPSGTDSILSAARSVADTVIPSGLAQESKDLRFQGLFHTYLAVSDASTVVTKGLRKGLRYVDNIKGGSEEVWDGGDLKFGGGQAVDR